jgi:uncharacterized damage-inducible protein DinB
MSRSTSATTLPFVTPDEMLAHWQGHRRLTRRVIERFPEDQLFSFSVGGMRPFGDLAMEIITMSAPMLRGVLSGEWSYDRGRDPRPKSEVLRLWDETTEEINRLWSQIAAERFHQTVKAFGQYEDKIFSLLMYVIDNEIHHRGQGFVYLRALGIEPPPFYER